MTWAEFRIRLYAYNREKKERDFWNREIAWNSLIAFSVDPKKLPKTIDHYISLDGGKKRGKITELMKERIKKAQEQYLLDIEKANNG